MTEMASRDKILLNKANLNYWQKRYSELHLLLEKGNRQFLENLEEQFAIATKNIKEKLDRFYLEFADLEEITYLEAQRLLNSEQLEEFHMSVEEYISLLEAYENSKDEEILKKLKRASLKYRVTRLEAIELQLMAEVAKAYSGFPDSLLEYLKDTYIDRYYRSIFTIFQGYGIGTSFSKIDERQLDKLLKKPWAADGIEFSERVWNNRDKLIQNLSTELTQGIILGDSYTAMTERLAKKMNTELYKARRVVATESSYFASLSQKETWDELQVDEYEIVAVLDLKTSEICQNQDGTVYKTKDFQPGKTAPPFHVNCRSTTAPYFDDTDVPGYVEGERAARGLDGKTYFVPASMKYEEWFKTYIANK